MQFFAGLEADRAAWRDGYLRAGARIASDSGLAGAHTENAKAAQFDAIACGKSIFHALKDRVDCRFCLDTRQSRTIRNFMNDVLFDQVASPVLRGPAVNFAFTMLGRAFQDCQRYITLVHSAESTQLQRLDADR